MHERRELPRWHIGKQAKVRIGYADKPDDCMIEDMNLKGMRVSLSEPLPQGYPIRMTLTLTDDFDFSVQVRVPWVRQEDGRYVHGVSFSIITDDDKDKVYQYMSRNCFKQFKDSWWAK